jgi:Na+/melibiose symporter-like transporter
MSAVAFGIVTILTVAWSGYWVKENAPSTETHTLGMVRSYLRALKNKSFVIVIVAFLAASLFESIGFSVFPFLIGFWYYQGDMQAMNNNLLWLMMPIFFISFPAVWFWTRLSTKIGKKVAVLIGNDMRQMWPRRICAPTQRL